MCCNFRRMASEVKDGEEDMVKESEIARRGKQVMTSEKVGHSVFQKASGWIKMVIDHLRGQFLFAPFKSIGKGIYSR